MQAFLETPIWLIKLTYKLTPVLQSLSVFKAFSTNSKSSIFPVAKTVRVNQ